MKNKNILNKIKERFAPVDEVQQTVDALIPSHVDESIKSFYDIIIKNQVQHGRKQYDAQTVSCPNCKERVSMTGSLEKVATRLAVATVSELLILREFIGIQPMLGPVGMVYTMRYKILEEENKMLLEVMSNTIEASSRKFRTNMTMNPTGHIPLTHTLGEDDEEMIRLSGAQFAGEYIDEIVSDMTAFAMSHDDYEDFTPTLDDTTGCMSKGDVIGCRIRQACSAIATHTRRGAGNFAIISLGVYEELRKTSSFEDELGTPNVCPASGMNRLQFAGVMNDTIRVFVDTHDTEDCVLVGYRGKSTEVDTGMTLAPYVPIMTTGIVMNPKTFEPCMSFMTRYGKFSDEKSPSYYRGFKVILDK